LSKRYDYLEPLMKLRTAILILSAAALASGMAAAAQAPATPAPAAATPAAGAGRGAPAVKSPEVSADGKITFRLRAPNAKEVFVTGIGQRIAMQKNEQGVWTATTDSLTLTDPANPLFKTSYGSAGSSLVHVPGAVSWEPAPGVARGAVTRHFYHSAVAGDDRDYWVYTPAGYDPKRKEAYPVLFLLHGLGDEAGSW